MDTIEPSTTFEREGQTLAALTARLAHETARRERGEQHQVCRAGAGNQAGTRRVALAQFERVYPTFERVKTIPYDVGTQLFSKDLKPE